MADFEQAGATERLRRVAILRDMQAKLRRSPSEALGVAAGAGPHEVRAAFMALTKQYHPTKFARLDEATVKLANEVFLQLREAYEHLATAGNKRARTVPGVGLGEAEAARRADGASAAGQGGPGVRVSDRASTSVGLGASVRIPDRSDRAGSTAGGSPPANANNTNPGAARIAGRRPLLGGNRSAGDAPASAPPTRPSSPAITSAAPTRPSSPAITGGRVIVPAVAPSSPPTRASSPAITGGRGSVPASSNTLPARPSAPSISTPASASSSASARPAAVPATGSGRVAAPSSSSPSSSLGGPKIRFDTSRGSPTGGSASGAEPAPAAGAAPSSIAELARIRGLIYRQQWTEARDALQLLLLRAPSDRSSMAQLAYVCGREALELGNVSEARRELLRALSIEPDMEAARAALRELNDPTPSRNPSAPRR